MVTASSCESVKKCAWIHHQTDEAVKPKRKSDKNSVATLNMHDSWLRMLQDDEPPKSSWRPRKSTKSCRPIKRAKIHKSHTVTEKGPSRGKIGLYRASWRGGHVPKIRDAPAREKT